jgi:galactokinase
VEEFQGAVARGYERATGRKPDIYIVRASDGVREALE